MMYLPQQHLFLLQRSFYLVFRTLALGDVTVDAPIASNRTASIKERHSARLKHYTLAVLVQTGVLQTEKRLFGANDILK